MTDPEFTYLLTIIDLGMLRNGSAEDWAEMMVHGTLACESLEIAQEIAQEDVRDRWTAFEMEDPEPDLRWNPVGTENAPRWKANEWYIGHGTSYVISQVPVHSIPEEG